jgi:hypothetical protein
MRNVRNAIYDKLQPYSINHNMPGIYCPYLVYDGLIKPRLAGPSVMIECVN